MQRVIDFKKVGKRIKTAREQKHFTQEQLGALCKCTNNHLSHLETGQSKPSLEMLLQLSNALDKDLNYFVLDTPYIAPNCVIDMEIAPKLHQCDASTLVAVNEVIDILLKQQRDLSNKYMMIE
ncbi:MAG: helix-turn-helix transcriptional regulator [Eubacteriales bacterium]|nr:helix-turn-helix transcriptional regulator [Eubacteriales bacterium]